jgi:hypothetical protein
MPVKVEKEAKKKKRKLKKKAKTVAGLALIIAATPTSRAVVQKQDKKSRKDQPEPHVTWDQKEEKTKAQKASEASPCSPSECSSHACKLNLVCGHCAGPAQGTQHPQGQAFPSPASLHFQAPGWQVYTKKWL